MLVGVHDRRGNWRSASLPRQSRNASPKRWQPLSDLLAPKCTRWACHELANSVLPPRKQGFASMCGGEIDLRAQAGCGRPQRAQLHLRKSKSRGAPQGVGCRCRGHPGRNPVRISRHPPECLGRSKPRDIVVGKPVIVALGGDLNWSRRQTDYEFSRSGGRLAPPVHEHSQFAIHNTQRRRLTASSGPRQSEHLCAKRPRTGVSGLWRR